MCGPNPREAGRPRVMVLAGNFRQYTEYCRRGGYTLHGILTADAPRYVTGVASLHGGRYDRLVRVGTWYGRTDAAAILDAHYVNLRAAQLAVDVATGMQDV